MIWGYEASLCKYRDEKNSYCFDVNRSKKENDKKYRIYYVMMIQSASTIQNETWSIDIHAMCAYICLKCIHFDWLSAVCVCLGIKRDKKRLSADFIIGNKIFALKWNSLSHSEEWQNCVCALLCLCSFDVCWCWSACNDRVNAVWYRLDSNPYFVVC